MSTQTFGPSQKAQNPIAERIGVELGRLFEKPRNPQTALNNAAKVALTAGAAARVPGVVGALLGITAATEIARISQRHEPAKAHGITSVLPKDAIKAAMQALAAR